MSTKNILSRVRRGVIARPQKVVIYGPEGIGKTTLASMAPSPLIVDTEGGTAQMDVARIEALSWRDILDVVEALKRDRSGFQTFVLDTVDWADKLGQDFVIESAKSESVTSIEDFGYGKGYTRLAEEFSRLLLALEELPMHKILLAHSQIKRFDPPDMVSGYDRYELKLCKTVSTLVKEWSDAMLFCQWEQRVKETKDGKKKGVESDRRFFHTVRSAAFDAKNRHGLAEQLPLCWESIAPLFPDLGGAPSRQTAPAAPEPEADPVAAFEKAVNGRENDVVEFLRRRGIIAPDGELGTVPPDYAARASRRIGEFLATVERELGIDPLVGEQIDKAIALTGRAS